MRNSSLVECLCTDDLPGLKRGTEFTGAAARLRGRGVFHAGRRRTERTAGLHGSKYAGVSNDGG